VIFRQFILNYMQAPGTARPGSRAGAAGGGVGKLYTICSNNITLLVVQCGNAEQLKYFFEMKMLIAFLKLQKLHCIEKSFICYNMCFTVWLMLTSNRQ